MLEAVTFSLSFYAWATAAIVIFLYVNTLFSNKFGLISTFIISTIIYISVIFGGRSAWLAEHLGWITEEQRDLASVFFYFMLCVAGTLSIRYLLSEQDDEELISDVVGLKDNAQGHQTWRYIVGIIFAMSVFILISYPLVNE